MNTTADEKARDKEATTDKDVMAISQRMIKQNKEAYEVLAKTENQNSIE